MKDFDCNTRVSISGEFSITASSQKINSLEEIEKFRREVLAALAEMEETAKHWMEQA